MASPAPPIFGTEPKMLIATAKLTTIDLIGGIKCHLCLNTFGNKKEFDTHYLNHNTGSLNIVYTCVVCHKEMNAYPAFRNHCYLIHVVKDKFKCKDCFKTFSKHSILQQHMDTMHKFVCATCKQQFPNKKEWQMHQVTHKSDSPPYDCQICKQSIQTVDDCEQHVDEHSTVTYSCPICNETIPDKSLTVEHLVKHFGVPEDIIPESEVEILEESSIDLIGILCCYCGITCKTRSEFDLHFIEQHNKNIIYSCNICGKQYDKYNTFGNHCYYHYSKGRFECDECDKSFPRLSLLVLHTAARHATFDTPKDLKDHQAVHKTGNLCQHCGLQFTSLMACERHIPLHRKKQYTCPICNRSYAEKYLVMKHIQHHFSSVLHLCKICGKIFNARNRLVQHIKIHSQERSHKCTFCGKGFVKEQQLTQHLNIHTGLKPFQCTVCPKTFASQPNWHKHMRRMHNASKVTIEKTAEGTVGETLKMQTQKLNNNNLVKDDFVDSTSSEMESYSFVGESDDSLVESDGIDPVAMEQESKIFETNSVKTNVDIIESSGRNNIEQETIDVPHFDDLMPVDSVDSFVAAITASAFASPTPQPGSGPPQEYGPDFGKDSTGFLDLDDQILPHIDPLLTIKPDMYSNDYNFQYENYEQYNDSNVYKWEPIIAKVFSGAYGYESDGRMSVNTDIF